MGKDDSRQSAVETALDKMEGYSALAERLRRQAEAADADARRMQDEINQLEWDTRRAEIIKEASESTRICAPALDLLWDRVCEFVEMRKGGRCVSIDIDDVEDEFDAYLEVFDGFVVVPADDPRLK